MNENKDENDNYCQAISSKTVKVLILIMISVLFWCMDEAKVSASYQDTGN